jgi:hypothetical protein
MISLFITNSDQNNTSLNGSKITLHLNPRITLDPNKKYYACAPEVDITYCFANIFKDVNDKFKYTELKDGILTSFVHTITQGIYTWTALQEEINRSTQENLQNSRLFVLEPDTSSSHMYIHFMTTTARIDCTGNDNMMQILGYVPSDGILGPVAHVNDYVEGMNARLDNVQNVLVLASFVSGSYQNAQAKNVLASVTPDVSPYSVIMYRPNMPIWVPVSQDVLETITFQLVDQDSNPINMGIHEESDKPERWSARIVIVDETKI